MPQRERRDLLLEAGLAMAAELSLPSVLQRIVEVAAEVTGARYGALGVIGPDGSIAQFITTGISAARRARIGPLPRGRGILGVLIEDATPLRLTDIARDPRSVGFPAHHPPMNTFMGAPVKALGRVYGNLYLTEKRGGDDFTEEDMESLLVLATQAGVAIANASLYEEARHRERWLDALREVSLAILSGAGQEATLELVCRHARELAGARTAVVTAPEPGRGPVVAAADGAGAARLRGIAVGRGRGLRLEGPAVEVALRLAEGAAGRLTVVNPPGSAPFDAATVRMVESFAEQAAVAYDYGRARRNAQRAAVLDDRERIATELHDGAIQSLFAVGMRLEAAALTADPDLQQRLGSAVDEIDRVIRELRNYIFGLRPGLLADRQLDQAVRSQVADFAERTGIAAEVRVEPGAAQALGARSADVVQFLAEALSNVARHSSARHVRVELSGSEERAVLVVEDDGKGFEPATVARGQGLHNLDERVRRLGGRLRITSRAGRGARLRATIPLR